MKTPNERIGELEEAVQGLQREVENVAGMIPWAIHKALEGLMDAKKVTYLEKRLIWEAVAKEIAECMATSPRLNRNLDYRLSEVERWSRERR